MQKRIPKKFIYLTGFLSFAMLSTLTILIAIEATAYQPFIGPANLAATPVLTAEQPATTPPLDAGLTKTLHVVKPSSTASETLRSAGLTAPMINELIAAAKPYADLGSIPSKTVFSLFWNRSTANDLRKIEYPLTKLKLLVLEKLSGSSQWGAKTIVHEVQKHTETFQGTVESTLWNSAMAAGIDSSVISSLSDIFAWQVNFSRDIHSGDSWRLSIERDYVDGQPIAWGNIIAAEFANGGETYSAVRFVDEHGTSAYYDRNGESLRRLFLKSPVHFSRISSGFTARRMHPILKINRPHNGVDYAAPTGTPVHAVGDGIIAHASFDSSSGNMVKITHNSTYSTSYHHLSRFADGIRPGRRIAQGEIIGFVGATGLATGPHLHFAFYERGVYVDPQGLKFPSADPVNKAKLPEYMAAASTAIESLPSWDIKLSHVPTPRIAAGENLDEIGPVLRTH